MSLTVSVPTYFLPSRVPRDSLGTSTYNCTVKMCHVTKKYPRSAPAGRHMGHVTKIFCLNFS